MVEGSRIGSYRIERTLGQGGMGMVYVGVDLRLGRRAAIKQLLPELSGQRDIVERFFNEAKAAANINHPGIVEIYEVGWHTDGSAYFAMKLLEGDSLARRLRRGPMPLAMACTITRQIASALAAAHAVGIVHRDLKPDNIILVRDDEVALGERAIVLDFGIAKLTGDWLISHKTRTDSVIGTPSYMSPEQCRGAGEVDHRTDVYAMGCLLFEMLAGRPPFVGTGGGEVIGMHQFVAPPAVRSFRRDVSPELETLVMRCLAKQADQRYQTMTELITVLQACATFVRSPDNRAVLVSPVGHANPSAQPLVGPATVPPLRSTLASSRGEVAPLPLQPTRKRSLVLGAVAAAIVTAIVVVAVVFSQSIEPEGQPPSGASGAAITLPDAALAVSVADAAPLVTASLAPAASQVTPPATPPLSTPPPTAGEPLAAQSTAAQPTAAQPTAAQPAAAQPLAAQPLAVHPPARQPPTAHRSEPSLPASRPATPQLVPPAAPPPQVAKTDGNAVPTPQSTPTAPKASKEDSDCSEASCAHYTNQSACCAKFQKPDGNTAPDAGQESGASKGKLPDSLDQAMVSNGASKVKAAAKACGDKWPATGQVKVSVKVASDGHVTSVKVMNTPDSDLGTCVAGVMQKATFATTRDGGSFAYSLQFNGARPSDSDLN